MELAEAANFFELEAALSRCRASGVVGVFAEAPLIHRARHPR